MNRIRRIVLHPLFFATLPLLLLAVWVERNMALPALGSYLMNHGAGLPLVFVEGGLFWGLVLNAVLMAIVAWVYRGMIMFSFPPAVKGFTLGFSILALVALWQPTGIVLFQAIPSAVGASVVSFTLFWIFLALAYQCVRIPRRILFLALAILATPMLSLDRLVFGVIAVLLVTQSVSTRAKASV